MSKPTAVKLPFRKLFSLLLSALMLAGALPAAAQTRRAAPATRTAGTRPAQPARQSTAQCDGGWSGVITYQKTLNDTANYKKKNIARGTTQHVTARDYKYTGKIFVDGSNPNSVRTKAQVTFNDTDKRFKRFEQKDTCFYDGKKEAVLQWGESVDNDIYNAFAEGEAKSFHLNFNPYDGTYSFSFALPDAKGTHNEETKESGGGWCNAKFNQAKGDTKAAPFRLDGEQQSIEYQKIDRDNPDLLSGSKTWETGSAEVKSFTYTVTWNFKRCPSPLELVAVEFDEHPYPDFKAWRKIEDAETVDSNIVRVRARVVNYSSETKFPQLKFTEMREGAPLPDSDTSISIAPGEEREVVYLWDTSGYAWAMGGKPMSMRNVKVDLLDPSGNRSLTKELLITPRPVILAHGLWADHTAWDGYDKLFYKAHSSIWRSFPVGKYPAQGRMDTGDKGSLRQSKTIIENAAELAKQIEFVQKEMNAWHLDVVAHSMGGIITRSYINDLMKTAPDGKPTIGHLVMLGTPNMGSPCANLIHRTIAPFGKKMNALAQLDTGYMHGFNRAVLDRKGVKFSNLVGTPVPNTCGVPFNGDGVVTTGSAIWRISDIRFSGNIHTALTSEEDFWRLVWRRLSASRHGDHNPDPKHYHEQAAAPDRQREGGVRFVRAGYARASAQSEEDATGLLPEGLKINLGKEVSLAPGQAAEVEIPAPVEGSSGVTLVAVPAVSASLFNERGEVIGRSAANTPEARADFRTLTFERPASNGTLRLKLENTGAAATSVIVSAWTNVSPGPLRFDVAAGKPSPGGQVSLTGRLTHDGTPVRGATVRAKIQSEDGKAADLLLLDDGAHGDGAAGDGTYAALTEKLAEGAYTVLAVAEAAGQSREAFAYVSVGGAPAKAAAPNRARGK